jgi:hypothetical protein
MPLAQVLDSRKGRMAILSRPKNDTSICHSLSYMSFMTVDRTCDFLPFTLIAWFISAAAKSAFRRRPRGLGELHVRSFLFQ